MVKDRYARFVLSYFRWYNRMCTSAHHPRYAPSMFLSAMQAMNLFGLSLLLLPRFPFEINKWLFAATFLAAFFFFDWINSKFIRAIKEAPQFSRLSDNVPGIREFPLVYCYLALTVSLIFLPALTI